MSLTLSSCSPTKSDPEAQKWYSQRKGFDPMDMLVLEWKDKFYSESCEYEMVF
jgi:hypothetical protein